MKQGSLVIDSLTEAVRRLPENGLAPSRQAALEHLTRFGLPTPGDEDWKYTDLSPAVEISNRWLEAGAGLPTAAVLDDTIDSITGSIDAVWLIVANGAIDNRFLDAAAAHGIDALRFSDAPATLSLERPLADLNAALLEDGLRVRIDGEPQKPLGILFIDRADTDAGVTQSRVEIEIAPGARAEIIEYHASHGDGDHYANSVLSLQIGDDANARHVRIQNRALTHVQTARTSISVGRNAVLRMAGYDLGGRLIRNDIEIDLGQPGADVIFDGLYLAGDGQHIDNHTRVDHRVGPATSSQEYRGILNGKCRCVWNGKAIVHQGADGTDATQSNHNLLLSENAEIDAKPELEIYADDVKCSHGTTVGQLDETALFYLRTRGLDKSHARQVLTHAFAVDLVRRAPIDVARDTVSAIVEKRLGELVAAGLARELLS